MKQHKRYISVLSILLFAFSILQATDYIHISEIMYDSPLNEVITSPPYSNGEYIELYNAGNDTANLAGWKLRGDGSTETLMLGNVNLNPNSAIIIAFQHSWTPTFQLEEVFPAVSAYTNTILYQNTITLKNTKEYIRLYDAAGLLRDSVYYGNETSIKPISDRLIATNADSISGSECLSVQRILVDFDANGVAVANHLHWTVDLAQPFLLAQAYTQPYIPAPEPGYGLPDGQNYIVARTHIKSGAEYLDQIQYFDGLGRPMQTVLKGITPQGNDLVSYMEYDGVGREWKNYLPITSTGNGDFVSLSNFQGSSQYNDSRAFVETIYEPSPLNRITAQKGPGTAWNNHPTTISYGTNGGDVKCFYVDNAGQLVKGSNYPSSSLYKTTTADEDGNTLTEYKDKLGHIVMTRQASNHDTYYVYNDLMQLCYVLPPLAADANGSADAVNKYGYVYKYDARGNCIYTKFPGCEPVYSVYDKANRLIFSQDGNQRINNQWTFHKYDELGRLIITGVYDTPQTQAALTQKCKDIVVAEIYNGGSYGYSWNKLPEIPFTGTLTLNYYDDYNRMEQDGEVPVKLRYEEKEAYSKRYQHPNLGSKSAKGLLVGTRVKLLGAAGEIMTAYYYDYRGRLIQTRATNHLGGYDIAYYDLDFVGNPKHILKEHNIEAVAVISEKYTYDYDHAGRLTTTTYQINDKSEVILSSNSYDELGRLITKQRHNNVDTETFAYNIRNQTTRITSGDFEQKLYYNSLPSFMPEGLACYNGNISCSTWTYGNEPARAYTYYYDNLNRYTSSYAYIGDNLLVDYQYTEQFQYDKMGNINRLSRYGNQQTYDLDHLVFTYNGNQMTKITNNSAHYGINGLKEYQDLADQQIEFFYDANGNLITDLDRDIMTIKYNILNLPELIQFKEGHQIKHLYDATGKKLETQYITLLQGLYNPLIPGEIMDGLDVNEQDLVTINGTAYIDNMEYHLNRYFDWDVSYAPKSVFTLNRVHNPEGYTTYANLKLNKTGPIYHYYRRDHLGNNREVWQAEHLFNNKPKLASTIQRTQYYPSGLPWKSSTADGAALQPYKYGGKEFIETHGLDEYYSYARNVYPAIMRTTTLDPHAESYYSISPYAWCGNNPVMRIDPDGKKDVVFNDDGTYNTTTNDNFWHNLWYGTRGIINDKNGNQRTVFGFNNPDDANRFGNPSANHHLTGIDENYLHDNLDDLVGKGVSPAKNMNIADKYQYIYEESMSGGNLDYAYSEGFVNNPRLFIIGGMAYDNYDAGNFVWGNAMNKLGVPYDLVKLGSEYNGFWNGKLQNQEWDNSQSWIKRITWTGDSKADQQAIRRGFEYPYIYHR